MTFGTVRMRLARPRWLSSAIGAPADQQPTIRPMTTIFTRIIDGELPGRFVWRDDQCVAFLSIDPIRPGHTLVVPIAEVDHWIDLDPPTWRRT